MKSYEEVIARLGKSMYHSYMGGGEKRQGLEGYNLVSYIYDVPEDKVIEDAEAAFNAYFEEKN